MSIRISVYATILLSWLPAAPALAAAAAPSQQPFAALPQDPAHGVRLEAALTVRDLRTYQSWSRHTRALLTELPVGRALYDPNNNDNLLGFDLLQEVSKLVALAAPSGAPVPAALAVYSREGELGIQAMLLVEDGFAQRVQQALAGANPPSFRATGPDSALELTFAGETFSGKVGADHWLRIAPDMPLLVEGTTTTPLFDQAMQRALASADAVLFILGDGLLHNRLTSLIPSPAVRALAQNARAAALTWNTDGVKTSELRVILDTPALEPFVAALRKKDIPDRLTRHLDADVVSFMSLALPPVLLQAVVPWAQARLSDPPYNVPADVLAGLRHLDGRLGWVAYDSPGDWAIAAELKTAEHTTALIGALQAWAQVLAKALTPGATQEFALEAFAGSPTPVFHLRPDPSLEGPYVAAIGNTIFFVQQHSRLSALFAADAAQSAADSAAPGGLLAGPLTPGTQALLARGHMLQGYMVLGSDGAWLDYLVWGAGRLQSAVARENQRLETGPHLNRLLSRVPKILALASYLWLRTYDLALAADVSGSLVTLQLNSSEI